MQCNQIFVALMLVAGFAMMQQVSAQIPAFNYAYGINDRLNGYENSLMTAGHIGLGSAIVPGARTIVSPAATLAMDSLTYPYIPASAAVVPMASSYQKVSGPWNGLSGLIDVHPTVVSGLGTRAIPLDTLWRK